MKGTIARNMLILGCFLSFHLESSAGADPRIYVKSELFIEAFDSFTISLTAPYSSLLLRNMEDQEVSIFLRQGAQSYELKVSRQEPEEHLPSSFVFLNREHAELVFWSRYDVHLSLELFDGLPSPQILSPQLKRSEPCEQPWPQGRNAASCAGAYRDNKVTWKDHKPSPPPVTSYLLNLSAKLPIS